MVPFSCWATEKLGKGSEKLGKVAGAPEELSSCVLRGVAYVLITSAALPDHTSYTSALPLALVNC